MLLRLIWTIQRNSYSLYEKKKQIQKEKKNQTDGNESQMVPPLGPIKKPSDPTNPTERHSSGDDEPGAPAKHEADDTTYQEDKEQNRKSLKKIFDRPSFPG